MLLGIAGPKLIPGQPEITQSNILSFWAMTDIRILKRQLWKATEQMFSGYIERPISKYAHGMVSYMICLN